MKNITEFGKQYIFLPDATRGSVRGLTNDHLKAVGTDGLVVNTLHLMIFPGSEMIKELGGIHSYMSWDGTVLSDSGGFQVFSLIHSGKWSGEINEQGALFKSPRDGSEYTLTPEKSIKIQMELGSDVLVLFDDCRKGVTTRKEAEESVDNTLRWAERCKRYYEDKYSSSERAGKLLSAVVQGANFPDLRERCATELVKMGFDGFNFGGYLLDDQGNLVVEQLKLVSDLIPDDKFKYGMGVGKPEDIFECAKLDYKVFDTVLPTRNARHGTLYSTDDPHGVIRVLNSEYKDDRSPIDTRCDCELCKSYTRAYLHHQLKNNELSGMALATIHNLRFYNRLIKWLNTQCSDFTDKKYLQILKEL